MVAALRDVNGRYVGNRPVRLKKSNWKERQFSAFFWFGDSLPRFNMEPEKEPLEEDSSL